jgi:hypothetical protein
MTNFGAVPERTGPFDAGRPAKPYPGLRPFRSDEWPIFFGREPMTDRVIDLVIKNKMVFVHGDSGCGKSSLIRAGVLVQLQQGHAATGGRWRTAAMLPREDPIGEMARALASLDGEGDPDASLIADLRELLKDGRYAPESIAMLLRQGEDDHICILIDQFEELFRYAQVSYVEAACFTEFLTSFAGDPPAGLYAIVTMRSEFLGHCARFEGLAETVNRTQYLLPRMEHPALTRAIRGPARLYNGQVSPDLADRLITDAGGGQDQLPLIQHGLMLLWQRKVAAEGRLAETAEPWHHENVLEDAAKPFRHEWGPAEPVARPVHESDDALPPPYGPAWRLDLEDYQGGGLETLLSDHADEVMAAAAPDARREKIVEHMFRALTDINAEGQAIRRPQILAELMSVTGSDEQILKEIVDQFRADGVSFLTPYGDVSIELGTLVDISHEALIRCWRKIKDGWIYREFEDGLIWKSLRIQAQKGETLSEAATEDRDAWLRTLPLICLVRALWRRVV